MDTSSSDCLPHSRRLEFVDPRDFPIDGTDVTYIEQSAKSAALRQGSNNMPYRERAPRLDNARVLQPR